MISLADFSVIVLAFLFSVYSLFSAFILGLSLELIWPKLTTNSKLVYKLFKPAWELCNVILALALTGFVLLFGASLDFIRIDIRPIVLILAISVAARSLLVIKICRTKKPQSVPKDTKNLLLASSLAVCVSLSALGVYMLLGSQFWQSLSGWILFASSLLGALAVALTLINAQKRPTRIVAGAWLLCLCCIWPLYLEIRGSHLLDYWFGLWLSFVVVIISLIVVTDGMAKKNYLRMGVPVLALITPVLLAAANIPELVSGVVGVNESFNTHNGDVAVWVGLVVSACLAIAGLWHLAKFLSPKKLI